MDYTTLRYDVTQSNSKFSLCKFAYMERLTKIFFLKRLQSFNGEVTDYTPLINDLAKNINEINKETKEIEMKISEIGKTHFEYEVQLDKLKEEYKKLEQEEYELSEKEKLLEKKYILFEKNDNLEKKLENLELKTKEVNKINESLKNEMSEVEKTSESELLNRLKNQKSNLIFQQRRMTIVAQDFVIDEVFDWYSQMTIFMKNFFSLSEYSITKGNGGFSLLIKNLTTEFELNFKNNKFCGIQNINPPINDENLEIIEKFAINLNNPIILIYFLMLNL